MKGKQRAESNPTAGVQHFNKQRKWTKYQWTGLRWHWVWRNISRFFVFYCTWWGCKALRKWQVHGGLKKKQLRHVFHLLENFRLIILSCKTLILESVDYMAQLYPFALPNVSWRIQICVICGCEATNNAGAIWSRVWLWWERSKGSKNKCREG